MRNSIIILINIVTMFNPKEKLEQIRRSKAVKEETSSFLAENTNPVPLFP